jgi:hypothetical protein
MFQKFSSYFFVSINLKTKIIKIIAIKTSKKAKILYHIKSKYLIIQAAISGVIISQILDANIKSQITFPNSFCFQHILKFSSKKACPVPLQKAKYNPPKIEAIKNQV